MHTQVELNITRGHVIDNNVDSVAEHSANRNAQGLSPSLVTTNQGTPLNVPGIFPIGRMCLGSCHQVNRSLTETRKKKPFWRNLQHGWEDKGSDSLAPIAYLALSLFMYMYISYICVYISIYIYVYSSCTMHVCNTYTLRATFVSPFKLNRIRSWWRFTFCFETNRIQFGSGTMGKLLPRSYSIEFKGKKNQFSWV